MEYGSDEIREFLQSTQKIWDDQEEAVGVFIEVITEGIFATPLSETYRELLACAARELYTVAYESGCKSIPRE